MAEKSILGTLRTLSSRFWVQFTSAVSLTGGAALVLVATLAVGSAAAAFLPLLVVGAILAAIGFIGLIVSFFMRAPGKAGNGQLFINQDSSNNIGLDGLDNSQQKRFERVNKTSPGKVATGVMAIEFFSKPEYKNLITKLDTQYGKNRFTHVLTGGEFTIFFTLDKDFINNASAMDDLKELIKIVQQSTFYSKADLNRLNDGKNDIGDHMPSRNIQLFDVSELNHADAYKTLDNVINNKNNTNSNDTDVQLV